MRERPRRRRMPPIQRSAGGCRPQRAGCGDNSRHQRLRHRRVRRRRRRDDRAEDRLQHDMCRTASAEAVGPRQEAVVHGLPPAQAQATQDDRRDGQQGLAEHDPACPRRQGWQHFFEGVEILDLLLQRMAGGEHVGGLLLRLPLTPARDRRVRPAQAVAEGRGRHGWKGDIRAQFVLRPMAESAAQPGHHGQSPSSDGDLLVVVAVRFVLLVVVVVVVMVVIAVARRPAPWMAPVPRVARGVAVDAVEP
mmetsp:Transcript_9467/g.27181  ORF Transcript_9467/g.27181 Transcript_9467/m.27181 type:complete len:249 (-) Transcript_9467:713-1459(-)